MKHIALLLILTVSHLTIYAQNYKQNIFAPDANVGHYFGQSVALNENYALIGADGAHNEFTNNDSGAAYLFKNINGIWTFSQKFIEPENYGTYSYFGFSVDINDDYAIYGSTNGTAVVYKRNGEEWKRQLLFPHNYGSKFGYSVAIDSSNIVVSNPDGNLNDTGAAWVFNKTGNGASETWAEVSKITPSDGYYRGKFGYDVDISGNHIIIGAWTNAANYYGRSGAYIYQYENNGWVEKQKLIPNGMDTIINHFGKSVSIYKNIVAVAAPEEINAKVVEGAVYIFEKNSNIWEQQAKITSPDTTRFGRFGSSIDLHDNKIIIGAYSAVFTYEKNGNDWQLKDSIHKEYTDIGHTYLFGASVAVTDNLFLAGAPDDSEYGSGSGSSFLYDFNSTLSTETVESSPIDPILIYPNPVNTILKIDKTENIKKILIYNSLGIKLKEFDEMLTNEIDFSRYKSGMYYLNIIDRNNVFKAVKVIKN